MKLKSMMLAFLAATVMFTSCSNDDTDPVDPGKDAPKSVTLKLEKSAITRAVEDSIANGTAYDFYDGYVFFVKNNGSIAERHTIANSDITSITTGNGKTYLNIPGEVDSVFVVANVPEAAKASLPGANASKAALKAFITQVGTQYNNYDPAVNPTGGISRITLYGKSGVVAPAVGAPAGTNHTAAVRPAPITGRLEIMGLQCVDTIIQSYSLEGIFINNFYKERSLEYYPVANLINNGSDSSKYDATDAAKFAYGTYPTLYDLRTTLNAIVNDGLNPLLKRPGGSSASKKVWAYNILATNAFKATSESVVDPLVQNNDTANIPHVIFYIKDVVLKPEFRASYSVPSKSMFLTVTGFNEAGTTNRLRSFDGGKVYRTDGPIKFEFKDLTTNPETQKFNLDVIIKLAQWQTVGVDPIF